jgi:hypothetical protein
MSITAAVLRSLAPIGINAAVLPTTGVRWTPGALDEAFQHSGNEFATHNRQPGADVRCMATIPFWDAYNLIGWKSLKCTTLNVFEAKYVDATRQTGAVHRKYALTASAVAHATIRSVSLDGPRGVAMAEVEFLYLAQEGTATTHPITTTDNNAIPALTAGPTLNGGGPITALGTNYNGVLVSSLDTGNRLEAFTHAGDKYPTVCQYSGGDPMVRGTWSDPVGMLDAIGLEGDDLAASPVTALWFRDYDATTGVLGLTGVKITLSRGRIMPDGDLSSVNRGVDSIGFRITCLADPSTPGTHPWVTASGQTMPT